MTSIADKGPDILYLGATVENNPSKVLQDMRSVMGEEVIFLGSDGVNNTDLCRRRCRSRQRRLDHLRAATPRTSCWSMGGPGGDYVTRVTETPRHIPRADAYAVYSYETWLPLSRPSVALASTTARQILTSSSRPKASSASSVSPGASPRTATPTDDHRSGAGDRR